MSKYSELFKDPRWQKKRLDILNRDGFACKMCGNMEITLHVHHKWYSPTSKPWEYGDTCLVTLCEDCHSSEHGIKSTGKELLCRAFLERGLFFDDFIDVYKKISALSTTEFNEIFGQGVVER